MRTQILAAAVWMLMFAVPHDLVAQRLATWSDPAQTLRLSRAPRAIADSSPSRRTWAGRGTVIGGVTGAAVGAAAFIHFTYRNSSLDNRTALAGVGMVGATLLGSAGALVGRAIGSVIPR